MSPSEPLPRLAVLIDAENITSRIAPRLFEEIATFGEASVRRIYGDFSEEKLKGWAQILADHAIVPQQNFALTAGKNGADIALVIDAMDLLHSGRVSGFCLVSSDSDFTRLAARIREQGLDVFGFGESKTPKSFRQACKRFVFSENLLPSCETVVSASSTKPATGPGSASSPAPRKPAQATAVVRRAIKQLEDEEGWVHLGSLGSQLLAIDPEFDPRTYGCAKLSTLMEQAGGFEVRGGGGKPVQIRERPCESVASASSAKPVMGPGSATSPAPREPAQAMAMVRRAIKQLDDGKGWVHLGGLGSQLLAMDPEFDPRTYGCDKLSTLMEQAGGFEVRRGSGNSVHVRERPAMRLVQSG